MSAIQGIHHVTAFAKSLNANHYFYTQVLGLRLVKQTVHQDNFHTPHLFYGDYLGSSGTLLSFFIYPKMGKYYQNDHYYKMITLAIPRGSVLYWKKQLESHHIDFELLKNPTRLSFNDPDGMGLSLIELDEQLSSEQVNPLSSVPSQHQMIRIIKASIHTNDIEREQQFYRTFLGVSDLYQHSLPYPFHLDFLSTNTQEGTRTGRGSIDHLAFSVKEAKDLDVFKDRAERLGYTVEKLIDRTYFKSLYVQSPSGLRVEIATEKPGMTIDEELEKLGNRLITFNQYENS
ncbi:VOC family protein [Marinilactibacillus kalidii]|uniref:VOC family protein n=1 Tax=Marinilactibacillus kalidii TaxID=2820274 RepID=UPI001ABEE1B7|nr:VOC family protein [Marinilactibacillus kalidii]